MANIERIKAMETALNESQAAVSQLDEAVQGLVDALDSIQVLSDYYGSRDWQADRKAEERGTLPANLSRDVLSEDIPYDVLVDARETALGALEVATAVLRSL